MAKLYFVGGSKGGVGKSFLSIALCDWITQGLGKKLMLIESDTSNPDVGKMYAKDEAVELVSLKLDDADGWIELVDLCDGCETDVVINSAARSNEAIAEFGGTLTSSLDELKMELVSFWMINRQRDSIELLKRYMEIVQGPLHVVRNTFYGEPKRFELFNSSKIREAAEERGETIDFPELADRVADELYSKRLTVAKALEEMPLGSRAELKRWRNVIWTTLGGLGVGQVAPAAEG
ncbi:MAG: protein mobD [Synergistaceae bacterium]|nr:protein mobD [Synergistaceae bacterium]